RELSGGRGRRAVLDDPGDAGRPDRRPDQRVAVPDQGARRRLTRRHHRGRAGRGPDEPGWAGTGGAGGRAWLSRQVATMASALASGTGTGGPSGNRRAA